MTRKFRVEHCSLFDPKDIECGICLEVLCDPHQCKEGHVFCRLCIQKSLKRSPKCPVCNYSMDSSSLARNRQLGQMINRLNVSCLASLDYNSQSIPCKWSGAYSAWNTHECLFSCMNIGCREVVNKTEFETHITQTCTKRTMECSRCNQTIYVTKLEEHNEVCFGYRNTMSPLKTKSTSTPTQTNGTMNSSTYSSHKNSYKFNCGVPSTPRRMPVSLIERLKILNTPVRTVTNQTPNRAPTTTAKRGLTDGVPFSPSTRVKTSESNADDIKYSYYNNISGDSRSDSISSSYNSDIQVDCFTPKKCRLVVSEPSGLFSSSSSTGNDTSSASHPLVNSVNKRSMGYYDSPTTAGIKGQNLFGTSLLFDNIEDLQLSSNSTSNSSSRRENITSTHSSNVVDVNSVTPKRVAVSSKSDQSGHVITDKSSSYSGSGVTSDVKQKRKSVNSSATSTAASIGTKATFAAGKLIVVRSRSDLRNWFNSDDSRLALPSAGVRGNSSSSTRSTIPFPLFPDS